MGGRSLGSRPSTVRCSLESLWAAPPSCQRGSRIGPGPALGTVCLAFSTSVLGAEPLLFLVTDRLNQGKQLSGLG